MINYCNYTVLTYPISCHLKFSLSEKIGCSDSESIGGSFESLSSPGECLPAFVCLSFSGVPCKDARFTSPVLCVCSMMTFN